MKIIADTNIFLAVVLEEPEKERIIQLTAGHELAAPEILPYEIGNALTALVKKKVLRADEVLLAWKAVQSIPVQLCGIDIGSALRVAIDAGIYAYDAYFIECALQMRCPLLTLDRRMKTVAREIGIQIME
ncbi:MAG: type II toxin-antitoxin system VapC family toxin [Chlorobiaceae bacterium]|nr:type II toxin-antitoxin system VapC family toxin [Chlorobiaceae bacterium]